MKAGWFEDPTVASYAELPGTARRRGRTWRGRSRFPGPGRHLTVPFPTGAARADRDAGALTAVQTGHTTLGKANDGR